MTAMAQTTPPPVGGPDAHDPLQPVLDDLDVLDHTDLADQVPVYERLHATLAAVLADTVEQTEPASGDR